MVLKELLDVFTLMDSPRADGSSLGDLFAPFDFASTRITPLKGPKGVTDVVRILVPGEAGKSTGGMAPTLGIIGQLGGIGARPEVLGMVSDGDGAVVAMAAALKLLRMHELGDRLQGDVLLATHICPNAPTVPHEPTPFMGSPVNMKDLLELVVDPDMDAILSIDTTRGNWMINNKGFAISPTVKQGYIMRPSDDLLTIMQWVIGDVPAVLPITMQDITPYNNGVDHINSIMQPSVLADCPVVGVALTSRVAVPGCAPGASSPVEIEATTRFCVEVAKAFSAGKARFYEEDQFARLQELYGSMDKLRTGGWVG